MVASLHDVVATWQAVRETPAKLEKRARLAALFARLAPDDLRLAACYLSGEIPQGAIQIGWRTMVEAREPERTDDLPLFRDGAVRPAATANAPLALAHVDLCFDALQRIGGAGAEQRRLRLLRQLFESASEAERTFLQGLLLGEMRAGALRAGVVEALAEALALPVEDLRRAVMFAGDFASVVAAAARGGAAALADFGPTPLVPVEPMLAATAADVTRALAALGPAAVEWKLDGVRVQLHRAGDAVRAFSRQLRDVTDLVPELQALGKRLASASFILDGEVVCTGPDGRPVPFQDLVSRFANESDAAERARGEGSPLDVLFFDLLYLDGASLVDRPYRERRAALERLVPAAQRVPALLDPTPEEAQRFYDDTLGRGHEGIVAKALESTYAAGRRLSQWLKVKPAVALDLVILAAEWGHGRRRGFLSNLHLGARLPAEPRRFAMLGKTFKGLTDAMLRELTADLLGLETHRDAYTVHVRPERVVEVAFDAVQRSRRYDSGFALRFARVKRFRPDKEAAEATTLDEVREVYERQYGRGA